MARAHAADFAEPQSEDEPRPVWRPSRALRLLFGGVLFVGLAFLVLALVGLAAVLASRYSAKTPAPAATAAPSPTPAKASPRRPQTRPRARKVAEAKTSPENAPQSPGAQRPPVVAGLEERAELSDARLAPVEETTARTSARVSRIESAATYRTRALAALR